jgi:hypothetical protein
MFAAMLLTISLVALAQFALYYWRALLTNVASQPISRDVLEAVHVVESDLRGSDFERLAGLLTLTPELQGDRGGLGLVSVYYKIMGKVAELFAGIAPVLASWGEQERVLCARYAAVQIGRRLEANLSQAASIRSC